MTFESWCQDSCRCCIGFLSAVRKGGTSDIWSRRVWRLEKQEKAFLQVLSDKKWRLRRWSVRSSGPCLHSTCPSSQNPLLVFLLPTDPANIKQVETLTRCSPLLLFQACCLFWRLKCNCYIGVTTLNLFVNAKKSQLNLHHNLQIRATFTFDISMTMQWHKTKRETYVLSKLIN